MRLNVLLYVLLIAAWLQPGCCTSSLSRVSSLSWEAARKAAKELYLRNLELAGLHKQAVAVHQPTPFPSTTAVTNATAQVHIAASSQGGMISSQVKEGVHENLANGACSQLTAAAGAQQCSNPETAATDSALTQPSNADRELRAAKGDTAKHKTKKPVTEHAASLSSMPAQQKWEYGTLISNIVCFLLGWLFRGLLGMPHQKSPQKDSKGVQTTVPIGKEVELDATCDASQTQLDEASNTVPLKQPRTQQRRQLGDSNSSSRKVGYSQQQCAAVPAGDSPEQQAEGNSSKQTAVPEQLHTKGIAAGTALVHCVPEAVSLVGSASSADDAAMPNTEPSTESVSSSCEAAGEGESHQEVVQEQELATMSGTCSSEVAESSEQVQQQLSETSAVPTTNLAEGLLMQIQAVQQNQLFQQPQQQQDQQLIHLSLTANPATLNAVVIPSLRIMQQLATGVQTLSTISTSIAHHAQQLSTGISSLNHRLDGLLSWAKHRDQQARLASQQGLGERASRLGLALLLVVVGVTAVRVGRVWDVHQECRLRGQQSSRDWRQRLTGTHHVTTAWQYTTCCAQELGLFAVGLVLLYWLTRSVWSGLLVNMLRSNSDRPSRNWQLDILVFKGIICSVVGAHVVHCLGAAWIPWLLLWWHWCGLQTVLQVRPLHGVVTIVLVAAVSLLLPVMMAVLPFHAQSLLVQSWLLEVAPVLRNLPSLRSLIP